MSPWAHRIVDMGSSSKQRIERRGGGETGMLMNAQTTRRATRTRMWHALGIAVVLLLHVAGSGAQGVSPVEAEDASFAAQAAAASSVAKEQIDWAVGAHDARGVGDDKSADDGEEEGEDAGEGQVDGAIYSKDGTWTLPHTALVSGAACEPHCRGVCMENCQFRQNPATGVAEDAAPCAADCKDMCNRGCSHTAAGGDKQHESLAADIAQEAVVKADGALEKGGTRRMVMTRERTQGRMVWGSMIRKTTLKFHSRTAFLCAWLNACHSASELVQKTPISARATATVTVCAIARCNKGRGGT